MAAALSSLILLALLYGLFLICRRALRAGTLVGRAMNQTLQQKGN